MLAFIANVDAAFEVTDPRIDSILFKFVLTRISANPALPSRIWKFPTS